MGMAWMPELLSAGSDIGRIAEAYSGLADDFRTGDSYRTFLDRP